MKALEQLYLQSADLADLLGVLDGSDGSNEYVDGTKIKANASSKNQLDRKKLNKSLTDSKQKLEAYQLE